MLLVKLKNSTIGSLLINIVLPKLTREERERKGRRQMGREMMKKIHFLEYLVYVICPYKF